MWSKMNDMEEVGKLFDKTALRKLIVPLIAEQALAFTVGLADTIMISSAGEAAISGVSLVDMFNYLIISVLAAFATGGAVVASQYIGAGHKKEACKTAKQLVWSVTAITVFLTTLIVLFREPILRLLFGKIEADVMHAALKYLFITALSYPFLALYNSGAALFRSMGNSGITFRVSILMNMINVVGNAIGIYVLHKGVAGVAVPSLISRVIASIIIIALLRNQNLSIHLDRGKYRPDLRMIRRIFYIAIPSGIENGIFQLGRVVVVSIISGFGTYQIAANGVANSLDAIGCIVGQGMNLAMITVIGQCVGAGSEAQVRYYTKKMMGIAYLFTAIQNITLLSLLKYILMLFGLGEAATDLAFLLVMLHNGFAILCWPAAFVLPNMLRACNDVRFTMVVSVASMIVFRIGLSVILGIHLNLGAVGVWMGMLVDWFCRMTFFILRYRSGVWKTACRRSYG